MFITRLIVASAVFLRCTVEVLFFMQIRRCTVKKVKYFHLGIIVALSVLIAVINPLKMDLNQRILFSSLICTVAVWATSAVHKSIACVFLLVMAMLFGKTKPLAIVGYLWSDTNILIMTTTLLSVGIMKTGIVHKYVERFFRKNSGSTIKLLLLPYIFGIALIFIIPQAFARVIIMGTIFSSLLLERTEEEKQAKQVLIFNVFIGISMVYMLFNNGDIVLNLSAIKFGGDEVKSALTFTNWFKMMGIPTLITSVVTLFVTYFAFRKELSYFTVDMISSSASESKELPKFKQQIAIITTIVIIAFWMTSSFHPISPWIISVIGVAIMFAISVLKFDDLKSINPHFILFLMTIFSIGKILGQSGITGIIFENLKTIIPNTNSGFYLLIIAVVVMILHLCIGSSVATMSVVLPIIIPLTQSLGYRPEVITLMTYVLVNIHFLLPFHQANVMIGTARGFYPENYMLRFGIYMTIISPILLALVYFPWWRFLGSL